MATTQRLDSRPPFVRAALAVAVAALGLVLPAAQPAAAAPNTIAQPDSGGQYTSLELDASGFPVVSYYHPGTGDLKVLHCGNATCTAGNVIASPDTANDVGWYTSLELDASGNPAVSYRDVTNFDLKVLRCGNPACTAGNTASTVDSTPTSSTGLYSSLALDGAGNPAVSHFQVPLDHLRVVRCNNPACTSATPRVVDNAAIVGLYSSIALDASDFPVVSYYYETGGDLKVVHCGDATCSAGNVITTPDTTLADVGSHTSLVLDASGNPVVSYYDQTNGNLKVLHCGNPNCTASNVITTPDSSGNVGQYTSIALDAAGNPVVSSYHVSGGNLRVLHCGNATCSAGNTLATPDSAGDVGQYSSIALDAGGNPVVSYYDATNDRLKVLRCGDPACVGSPAVGGMAELPDVAASGGGPWARWGLAVLIAVVALGAAMGARRAIRLR